MLRINFVLNWSNFELEIRGILESADTSFQQLEGRFVSCFYLLTLSKIQFISGIGLLREPGKPWRQKFSQFRASLCHCKNLPSAAEAVAAASSTFDRVKGK